MLAELNKQLRKLSNQARFVQMIIKKELVVSNKKRAALITELQKLKFDVISNKKDAEKAGETEPVVEEEEEEQDDSDVGDGYNYLLGVCSFLSPLRILFPFPLIIDANTVNYF